MTTFTVMFEGSGFALEAPEGLARGFFVTVTLDAPDAETAEARARRDVYRAWTAGGYDKAAGGVMPDLAVDDLRRVGPLRALFTRKGTGGFVLFPEE
ncbi:hypothetical protein OCH239_04555 [Roseivivax halodurans JCM 10272]|uniref:Uncharacterized protein n=1 Tax=Roseivivax halodurans JCM 10272 TaxID=1449350 RepID=X7EG80_9RHOB|nr:hypothetical protein [Roseivivax halodurans]ETX14123.1 hypothetical protein OCH239_04555 [Roseivivax halodurans JCM 10272]